MSRIPSLVTLLLVASAGTASAAPFPVSQPFDRSVGKVFVLRKELPAVNSFVDDANRLLDPPLLERIGTINGDAGLHGYATFWAHSDSIGARADAIAFMHGYLGFPGGEYFYGRWLRASAEAATRRYVNDPTMTCPGCSPDYWMSETLVEVANETNVVWLDRRSAPGSVDHSLEGTPPVEFAPLDETYRLNIGLGVEVDLHAVAKLDTRLKGGAHVDPGGASFDVAAPTNAFLDITGWSCAVVQCAWAHAHIDVLKDVMYDVNNDGRVDEVDAGSIYNPSATRATMSARIGEIRYSFTRGFEVCGRASADVWFWNVFQGWVSIATWGVQQYSDYFPFGGTTNKHLGDSVEDCMPLLHSPY